MGLMEYLRTHSRVSSQHNAADKFVVACSVFAFADTRVWLMLLCQFRHVYLAIEAALEEQSHKLSKRVKESDTAIEMKWKFVSNINEKFFSRIKRDEAFLHDINFFEMGDKTPEKWKKSRHAILNNTKKFCDHILCRSRDEPLLALIYAYTMYSALLAGGAALRRMQRKAMGLKSTARFEDSISDSAQYEEGSAIFDFRYSLGESKSKQRDFRMNLVDAMDKMKIGSSEEVSRITEEITLNDDLLSLMVQEKSDIFSFNNKIITQVMMSAPITSYFSLLFTALKMFRKRQYKNAFMVAGIFCAAFACCMGLLFVVCHLTKKFVLGVLGAS